MLTVWQMFLTSFLIFFFLKLKMKRNSNIFRIINYFFNITRLEVLGFVSHIKTMEWGLWFTLSELHWFDIFCFNDNDWRHKLLLCVN